MASYMLNDKLNKYFIERVQMSRDETSHIVDDVMKDVFEIIKKMNELCPLFGATAHRVGSYYQGLKVKRADEFDLSIPLLSIGQLYWGQGTPRCYDFNLPTYEDMTPTMRKDLNVVRKLKPLPEPSKGYATVTLRPGSESAQAYSSQPVKLMFEDHLIPFLVKRHLKDVLHKALESKEFTDRIKVDKNFHGPAITLAIQYQDQQNKTIKVNVDFAAIIRSRLSFPEYTDWLDRARKANWPSAEKIAEIKEKGINLVAKKDFEWQISFAECEKALVHGLDADGGIRKKVHRIMKSVYEDACKNYPKRELSSYMLKNAWLLECERLPNPDDWKQINISERYLGCVRCLKNYIAHGILPQYFCRTVNLLKDKDLEKIKQIVDKMDDLLENI